LLHVGFVAEKYNKQRRRETIQGEENIIIFNESNCSEQQYYRKTEINNLLMLGKTEN